MSEPLPEGAPASARESYEGFREAVGAARDAARRALIEHTIETYADQARDRAAALKTENPDVANDQLAERLISAAAGSAAAAGALVAVPGIVPGPGTIVTVALAGPETAWLFREQIKLVLELAALYGRDPSDRVQRTQEVEALFDAAWRAVLSGNTAAQMAIMAALRAGRGRGLLEPALSAALRLSRVAVRRGRFLPFLGIPIGAVVNASAVRTAGEAARRRYGHAVARITEDAAATAAAPEAPVEEEPAPDEGEAV